MYNYIIIICLQLYNYIYKDTPKIHGSCDSVKKPIHYVLFRPLNPIQCCVNKCQKFKPEAC